MDVEANLNVNKTYYKLFIVILKYIPMIIALCYVLNTVTAMFGIYVETLSNIAGMSLFTWIFLYTATYVFRFCAYHRMFLWYILTDDLLNIADYYYELPIETGNLLILHNSIIGIFLFIILYLYVKSHKKPTIEDNK